ncbi:MAG: acyltransferase family protein [Janthinobacterium lividum]
MYSPSLQTLSSPARAAHYLPGIDGLRAIAVLSVIVFHLDFLDLLPGGFTGVDMFFVISGYVITRALAERTHLGFGAYLLDFYRRRLLRILPALLVVLLVSFVVAALFVPQVWLSNQNDQTGLAAIIGLSNFTLAGNTNPYFSPRAELNPFLHTWSLGVEEQFYLLFPAIYFLYRRCRTHLKFAWALLPALALASLIVSGVQTATDPLSAFYLLPSRFWELAAGALLFQALGNKTLTVRGGWLAQVLLMAGMGLVTLGFVYAERKLFPFPWALVTVSGTLLLIAAVTLQPASCRSPLHTLLQSPPLVYVGRLSYSLYLWHWPVAVFLRWTTGLELLEAQVLYPFIVLALAAGSYHWIETPIRAGRSMLQRNAWVAISASLVAVGMTWLAALWITDNTAAISLSQTRDSYLWHAYKHYPRETVEPVDDPEIEGRQLFVLGDSHTAAYRTLLKLVELRLGVQVREYEHGGCAVVSLIGADPEDCDAEREAALADIEARANPGDIVWLASLRMPELAGRDWQAGEQAAWAQALAEVDTTQADISARAMLTRLAATQAQILIDAPKPLFKAPPNRCSDGFNHMNPVCAPGLTVERAQIAKLRAPQLQLLAQLQRDYPSLHVWDPLPLLCPYSACSAYDREGRPLYNDSDHLSGHGNRTLERSLTEALISIWRDI